LKSKHLQSTAFLACPSRTGRFCRPALSCACGTSSDMAYFCPFQRRDASAPQQAHHAVCSLTVTWGSLLASAHRELSIVQSQGLCTRLARCCSSRLQGGRDCQGQTRPSFIEKSLAVSACLWSLAVLRAHYPSLLMLAFPFSALVNSNCCLLCSYPHSAKLVNHACTLLIQREFQVCELTATPTTQWTGCFIAWC
jgi:hypothetical protein